MRRREISCLDVAVVIGLCGGLQGEEVFLKSLKGMLKFWEETRNKKDLSHIMVTFKGRFKVETGETRTTRHHCSHHRHFILHHHCHRNSYPNHGPIYILSHTTTRKPHTTT